MKVSDYIVEYLIKKGITDVFGYPGGMVTHLMDSLYKYSDKIAAHVTYHEQGAAFAACGYAQTSGRMGVAYATSGPGATNLITGICNAYFDSIPTLFITGQVNTFESKGNMGVRQRGFQETEVISMVKGVTKYAEYVKRAGDIKMHLDKAFYIAFNGRPGPVLLDIPMNIFRSDVKIEYIDGSINSILEKDAVACEKNKFAERLNYYLRTSVKPCILVGNGIKSSGQQKKFRQIVRIMHIPVVSSMIAFDTIPNDDAELLKYSFGFIGAYGDRYANFILSKSDLVISIGSRLDVRQIGAKREYFAPNAKILRVDIDAGEMENKVRANEEQFVLTIEQALNCFYGIGTYQCNPEWLLVCDKLRNELHGHDAQLPNNYVEVISQHIPDGVTITTDVGQNQVWVAQSFRVKENQKVLFSGGHGAMGYSLPASIGAYYGTRQPVISFNGDGGMQMNIQELQFVVRENLPIKIVIFNNSALGMIRHFQEMYFEDRYMQTVPSGGYTIPDFTAIASAYGIQSRKITDLNQLDQIEFDEKPEIIEIMIHDKTYVFPKLEFGKPNQDQEPLLERDVYDKLMSLDISSVYSE